MRAPGLTPTTINKACPHENGDVESAHGHLKRRLKAHLALRGTRDFADEASYAGFVAQVCTGANALRAVKLAAELTVLRPLPATRYPEAQVLSVRVSCHVAIRVTNCAYSVPARLIGAIVDVEVSETTVVVWYECHEMARDPRSASKQPRIDYRHLIASLVRKPGAFAGYLYREELFPRPVFRHAYDRLNAIEERKADARNVRLLALAAELGEERVADHLGEILRRGEVPLAEAIASALASLTTPPPAAVVASTPELHSHDALLAVSGLAALREVVFMNTADSPALSRPSGLPILLRALGLTTVAREQDRAITRAEAEN